MVTLLRFAQLVTSALAVRGLLALASSKIKSVSLSARPAHLATDAPLKQWKSAVLVTTARTMR
jgi:hypothetical protein